MLFFLFLHWVSFSAPSVSYITFEVEREKVVHKETAICLGITEESQFPLKVKKNTKVNLTSKKEINLV